MADLGVGQLVELAKQGKAIPEKDSSGNIVGGSFPIRDEQDLKNAIQAIGRAKNPAEAKAHIVSRAKALGLSDLIPKNWSEADFQSLFFADASKPFEILRVGKTVHPSFGETDITEADLDQAVSNFKAQAAGSELPVDWEHSYAEGGGSRAAGWITELFRQSKSLMAKVRWTDKAREDIDSEQYRYISAEFNEDWADESGKDRGFTLLAAGLTNRPFLKNMSPVALSERIPVEEVCFVVPALEVKVDAPTETPPRVADPKNKETEGLTFSDEELVEIREKLGKEKDAELEVKDFAELAEKAKKFDEAEAEKKAAEEKAKSKDDEAKSFKDEVKTLSETVTDLTSELLEERRDADLSQARREGRIDATDETTKKWSERYEKLGRETAKELLFELPAETIPMKERGHGDNKPLAEQAPEGTDPESYELDLEVKEYMEKHEDVKTYGEALQKVSAQKASEQGAAV